MLSSQFVFEDWLTVFFLNFLRTNKRQCVSNFRLVPPDGDIKEHVTSPPACVQLSCAVLLFQSTRNNFLGKSNFISMWLF